MNPVGDTQLVQRKEANLGAVENSLTARQTSWYGLLWLRFWLELYLSSIQIANNSYRAAEEARRDSASMKTIAVVTLVFLPGTFVAVRILASLRQDKRLISL